MKTTSIGLAAESAVADKLKDFGYKIIERNWKTKVCEIDIVASKDKVVYFVEVKYRSGTAQGTGLDYIGPQKLKRLNFAVQVWAQAHNYEGDYRILAVSVSTDGQDFIVHEPIEL